MGKKTSGKVYNRVAKHLKEKGISFNTLQIYTLGRGTNHIFTVDDEPIGEYNHKSDRCIIWAEVIEKYNQQHAPEA